MTNALLISDWLVNNSLTISVNICTFLVILFFCCLIAQEIRKNYKQNTSYLIISALVLVISIILATIEGALSYGFFTLSLMSTCRFLYLSMALPRSGDYQYIPLVKVN